jgi:hypothetical protein
MATDTGRPGGDPRRNFSGDGRSVVGDDSGSIGVGLRIDGRLVRASGRNP